MNKIHARNGPSHFLKFFEMCRVLICFGSSPFVTLDAQAHAVSVGHITIER